MAEIIDKSCREFTYALASKAPVPGGGGAAGLGGALGMALGLMVGNLTVGKKKYAEVEDEVEELIAEGEKIQDELLATVAEDAAVFEPLSKAYGLPTSTESEKNKKAEVLDKESKNACSVPLKIAELAYRAMKIQFRMGEIGSRLVISDVGCGVAFLAAAIEAAALNVKINLGSIKDKKFVENAKLKIEEIQNDGKILKVKTMKIVEDRLY